MAKKSILEKRIRTLQQSNSRIREEKDDLREKKDSEIQELRQKLASPQLRNDSLNDGESHHQYQVSEEDTVQEVTENARLWWKVATLQVKVNGHKAERLEQEYKAVNEGSIWQQDFYRRLQIENNMLQSKVIELTAKVVGYQNRKRSKKDQKGVWERSEANVQEQEMDFEADEYEEVK